MENQTQKAITAIESVYESKNKVTNEMNMVYVQLLEDIMEAAKKAGVAMKAILTKYEKQ